MVVEPVFGRTLSVAKAIRAGRRAHSPVSVTSVTSAGSLRFAHADVAVAGGPGS